MSVGIILQGEGSLQGWNQEAEELLGLAPQQMKSFTGLGFPLPAVGQDSIPLLEEKCPARVAFDTKRPCSNQVLGIFQGQGELIWLTVSSQPLLQSSEAAPYAVVTTFEEIAPPLQIEEARRTNEQERAEVVSLQLDQAAHRLTEIEALYATAPIGLCFVDTDLRFVRINERLAKMNGIPMAAHIGKTLREIFPEMADELETLYRQVIQTGVPIERLEVGGTNAAQPGVERYWLLSLYPLKAGNDNQVWGVNVMVDEITERKQADAALIRANGILRAVIDGTEDVIFVKDLQGRYVLANAAAADWLETTVEEMLGQDDTTLFPPEKAQQIQQDDRQIIEIGQTLTYEEENFRQGKLRSLSSTKYPWRDAEGNILGMIGIVQDISDRKQSELEQERLLQQEQFAREQAEKANRIKDEFLAVLSHELRSPLNPILGWSKLLQEGRLDAAKTKEALASIERNAQLQSQLIEDLLDISRILQGKLTLAMAPVNLSTMTRAALDTGRSAAEDKNIEVQTIFSPHVGLVLGDASRLQQIVWNLLSNAIKFTPPGGRVEVRLTQIDRYAQIQVCDTGKGISADFLPYVFEHFRQEDGATTRKFGGLGLGLAIVRQLVELHHGRVLVESPGDDQGATFTIQLPLLQATELTAAAAAAAALPPIVEAVSLAGLKILVVDDELDSRSFVTFALEQAGAEVVALPSAIAALQSIQELQPDLLLSDIGMPEMDGYMLIDSIRQQFPSQCQNLLAIALTAYAGEANEQKVLQAGFQKHLAKPVDPSELVRAIAQLVAASL